MIKIVDKLIKKNDKYLYFIFRVVIGFMFLQHGAQKLFGLLGGQQVELVSLYGLAGVIEFSAGLFIAVGLFTQISAIIGGLEILTAFFIMHLPRGWNPILNGGELSLMYFVSFIVLAIYGAKMWSLESYFKK